MVKHNTLQDIQRKPGQQRSVPERTRMTYDKAAHEAASQEARYPPNMSNTGMRFGTGELPSVRNRIRRNPAHYRVDARNPLGEGRGYFYTEPEEKEISLVGSESAVAASGLEGLRNNPELLEQLAKMLSGHKAFNRERQRSPSAVPPDPVLDEAIKKLPIPPEVKDDISKNTDDN